MEYVDFSPAPARTPPVALPGPMINSGADGQPRKGMLRAEAERELGKPIESADRREGALTITTLVFVRGEQRISAEFVEGVLFRYAIASK